MNRNNSNQIRSLEERIVLSGGCLLEDCLAEKVGAGVFAELSQCAEKRDFSVFLQEFWPMQGYQFSSEENMRAAIQDITKNPGYKCEDCRKNFLQNARENLEKCQDFVNQREEVSISTGKSGKLQEAVPNNFAVIGDYFDRFCTLFQQEIEKWEDASQVKECLDHVLFKIEEQGALEQPCKQTVEEEKSKSAYTVLSYKQSKVFERSEQSSCPKPNPHFPVVDPLEELIRTTSENDSGKLTSPQWHTTWKARELEKQLEKVREQKHNLWKYQCFEEKFTKLQRKHAFGELRGHTKQQRGVQQLFDTLQGKVVQHECEGFEACKEFAMEKTREFEADKFQSAELKKQGFRKFREGVGLLQKEKANKKSAVEFNYTNMMKRGFFRLKRYRDEQQVDQENMRRADEFRNERFQKQVFGEGSPVAKEQRQGANQLVEVLEKIPMEQKRAAFKDLQRVNELRDQEPSVQIEQGEDNSMFDVSTVVINVSEVTELDLSFEQFSESFREDACDLELPEPGSSSKVLLEEPSTEDSSSSRDDFFEESDWKIRSLFPQKKVLWEVETEESEPALTKPRSFRRLLDPLSKFRRRQIIESI